MSRAPALAAVISALLLSSSCGGSSQQTASSPPSQTFDASTRLADLEHPDRTSALFSLFNADQGTPRLLLLMSPT